MEKLREYKWVMGMITFVSGIILGVFVMLAAINGTGVVGFGNLIIMAIAVALSAGGTFVLFTNILDDVIKPLLIEAKDALDDDIDDVKKGRLTSTQAIFVLTIAAGMWFIFMVLKNNELSSTWGFVPVVIPTFFVVGAAMWWIVSTDWFQDNSFRMPFWVFLIPLAGLLLSTYLGLNAITNDARAIESGQPAGSTYYMNSFNNYYVSGGNTSNIEIPKCSGKSCEGEAYLFLLILLIVLTLILILGSAVIPHFWLLAGALFLGIMWLIALHELKVRPGRRYSSW